jgi:hypothetical protein
MRIIKKGEHRINICCMMVFCIVLTSFVFPLVLFTFCFCRKRMRWFDWIFWSTKTEDVLVAHFFSPR